ncbi:hypothetical protein BAUCODRAFT_189074 [Baudoinia panamericana UAMH 10762]|uniref:Uncharacterized protein n=1 Tax=Baudoinia panamericana (strain UAMH 10762) TaxID=717646 RepID=M2NN19_BAUPA|nr:uncharacterized protein BAUCODRAFT_189074 [Baudoinia panamericana UAMH 10762]EMD00915.1 hypothetical protein BAUCODRAFT_189074 [Baudoinia panamericana UAMH 10762]
MAQPQYSIQHPAPYPLALCHVLRFRPPKLLLLLLSPDHTPILQKRQTVPSRTDTLQPLRSCSDCKVHGTTHSFLGLRAYCRPSKAGQATTVMVSATADSRQVLRERHHQRDRDLCPDWRRCGRNRLLVRETVTRLQPTIFEHVQEGANCRMAIFTVLCRRVCALGPAWRSVLTSPASHCAVKQRSRPSYLPCQFTSANSDRERRSAQYLAKSAIGVAND